MTALTFQKQTDGLTSVGLEDYIDGREIYDMLKWIDDIPFSRPKFNVSKDFSDGVMVAEIIKHYFPKMVDVHNYPPANATAQKIENWCLLNRRVLRRLNMELSHEVIRAIAHCKPRVVQRILIILRIQIDKQLQRQGRSRMEVDLEYVQKQKEQASKQQQQQTDKQDTPEKKGNSQVTPKDSKPDSENSRALVPVSNKSTGRASPAKSPRKTYGKGEIPHDHPNRSYYNPNFWEDHYVIGRSYADKKIALFDAGIPFHSYLYRPDHIPRVLLEEKEVECMEKDETIHMLNAKVRNLEHLLELRQARIDDLQGKLIHSKGIYYVTTHGARKMLR